MMEDADIENRTTDSVGGNTLSTLDMDGEEPVHDQLPSVEEYKANMTGASSNVARNYGDDEEEIIHDQLPSVEEIKAATATNTQPKMSCCRKCLCGFAVVLIIAMVLAAIIVPVALKKDVFNPRFTSRRFEVVKYLITQDVSTEKDLATPGTPQYDAATWIADDDAYYMAMPTGDNTYNRFVERYTLAVIYYATNGPNWKYDMNFLEPVDACSWYTDFVTTAGTYLRLGVRSCGEVEAQEGNGGGYLVLDVDLSMNDLDGEIPGEIQNLHRLKSFFTTFNSKLRGSITRGMLKLDHLQDLEMQYCSLTGTVPDWLGDMRSLTSLGLGNNFLTGEVPSRIFELDKLEVLGLDDNSLEGDLESFGQLTNLQNLYLEDNSFDGALTEDMIDSWQRMVELDLSKNKIDSNLPNNIFSMPALEVLDLNGNKFKGTIPDIPAENNDLVFLALYDNALNGEIPASINNLTRIEHLDLSRNSLILPYPDTMGQLTRLRYLFTGSNAFADHDMPKFVTQLTKLRELSMKDNNLTGKIPTTIGALTSLQLLDLDQNKLTGPIPEEFGLMKGLDHVLLNRNQLSGTLPASFALMHDLDVLLIDGNDFTGSADVICKDDTVDIAYFVSDCKGPDPEFDCECCQLCCNDSNVTCNNFDWNVNLDPIWEYGYTRFIYQFSQELLPPP